ncbi:hypothetical protein BN77_3007 [Rhizobium mesoamericanum STM3625]|uniref:Uncharacterized protein n=1 Tax=Rhizobium mesoamericanum STM3625 TaxID=1211777 RepID=K0PPM5_9HYPH|nr:hypothetical protein BN77_3007 [Rhizobium mesoamericanum STM3625]
MAAVARCTNVEIPCGAMTARCPAPEIWTVSTSDWSPVAVYREFVERLLFGESLQFLSCESCHVLRGNRLIA